MNKGPVSFGGHMRIWSKTERPWRNEGREPTGPIIGKMRAERSSILARDAGGGAWWEVTRGRVEGTGMTDEARRSAENDKTSLERRERIKYKRRRWGAVKEEKWSHCGGQIVWRNYFKLNKY